MADDATTTRTVKAYHEAGHAVFAYLVGMTLESVDGNKNVKFSGDMTTRDHIKSLLAGGVAEGFSPKHDPNLFLSAQDSQDMRPPLARTYADAHGGDPEDDDGFQKREVWCRQYGEECLQETEEILGQPSHRYAITVLADLLVVEGMISGERATQVIGAAISASIGAGGTEVQSATQYPSPSPKPHHLVKRLLKWVRH